METAKELNRDVKDEVNKVFTALFREIGSNRQQLANKVLGHQKEIFKELNREEINEERKKELLVEVAKIVKMASQQLPHMKLVPSHPAGSVPTQPKPPKIAPPKKPEAATAKKPEPKSKVTATKSKPSGSKTKKVLPAKKKK